MSTTPLNLSNFSPKSFFSRPEGKWFGIPVLLALAAVGIYGFFQALPFLLIAFTNMIYLGVLGAVLIGMIMLALNPTVQCVVKNMFQSFCRGVAGILVTIDPIGILKNNLDDMKKDVYKRQPQGVFALTLGSTPIYHLALKNLVFKLVEWVVLATPVFTIIVSDT